LHKTKILEGMKANELKVGEKALRQKLKNLK
jgi:hypothetical protein